MPPGEGLPPVSHTLLPPPLRYSLEMLSITLCKRGLGRGPVRLPRMCLQGLSQAAEDVTAQMLSWGTISFSPRSVGDPVLQKQVKMSPN